MKSHLIPWRSGAVVPDRIVTRRYVQARLAELPARPEDADTRLRGLLGIYEDLNADGDPEPLNAAGGGAGHPGGDLVLHRAPPGRG